MLGKKVKDKVTEFEGRCIGVSQYLFGEPRILVALRGVNEKTGAPHEGEWFAQARFVELPE